VGISDLEAKGSAKGNDGFFEKALVSALESNINPMGPSPRDCHPGCRSPAAPLRRLKACSNLTRILGPSVSGPQVVSCLPSSGETQPPPPRGPRFSSLATVYLYRIAEVSVVVPRTTIPSAGSSSIASPPVVFLRFGSSSVSINGISNTFAFDKIAGSQTASRLPTIRATPPNETNHMASGIEKYDNVLSQILILPPPR